LQRLVLQVGTEAAVKTERNTSERDLPTQGGFDRSSNSLMQLAVAVLRARANQARATTSAIAAVRC
jgi:hypothetical protein